MKKKIVFIAQIKNIGGIERSLINLLQDIPPEKHSVTVVVLGEHSSIIDEIPEWITVKCVKGLDLKQYIKKAVKGMHMIKAFKLAFNILVTKFTKTATFKQYQISVDRYAALNENYDAAIGWALPDAVENIYLLNRVTAKKKVMLIHMDLKHYKMPQDSIKYLKNYDSIVSVSKSCKASFDEMYPSLANKSYVFYNVINKELILSAAQQKGDLSFDKQGFSIVTCGRIAKEKRPFLAIDICKALLNEGIADFKWYFIGDGSLKQELYDKIQKNNLQKHMILMGKRMNPYTYVKDADLYVQMSRHESFCLTLAEAQILGVPAVSTNFPAAYEIVDDMKTGFITEQTSEALFSIIKSILTKETDLNELKENTSKYDCSVFSGRFSQFEEILF